MVTVSTVSSSTVTTPFNTTTELAGRFETCPKFLLPPGEFQLVNGSVVVAAYRELVLPPGQFWLQEDGVLVCRPVANPTEKFSSMMGYVTCACLGVSLVCLLVHLAISCIAPELHNLSGKNLFSLSLALAGAYTAFLTNMFTLHISPEACLVLAVLMYYFYLASFFWMLNIGFDVARTLKLATTELRLTSGSQWGKFICYSAVGWLLPAAIAGTALTIDLGSWESVPDFLRPGFGDSSIGLCWFSNRSALIIYFVIPFSIIMTLNLVFFLSSAWVVWESTRSSAKITTSGPKTSFYLYLRLAVLMGLSWLAGLVAGGLDIEWVWYLFLVLNTLQGLFILVFFSCSKKVVSSVRERLTSERPESTNSTWQWSGVKERESEGGGRAGIGRLASSTSHTSYAQYHKYDQRYYSSHAQ